MPAVSVVIPNWNGARLLGPCLDAVRRQTLPPDEVLVVDDGSTDDSLRLLADQYPEVQVVARPGPLGVARGFNDGIRATTAPLVVLLNNDTEPEPDWLAALCRPFDQEPDLGMAASKLLLFDRRTVLHSAGDFYGRDGMPGNRGVWQEDRGQFDGAAETFGPCGAAAAYRRSMLAVIGLFDESLGSYCEDVELSFRARLAGYRCRFVAAARVYHRLSATGGGPFASYYVGRNVLWVLARLMPAPLLARYWPKIVARQLAIASEALRHWRQPAARARLRGQLAGLRGFSDQRAWRAAIQRRRQISIPALDALLT
jgi:GT2 family glycosyltransferase